MPRMRLAGGFMGMASGATVGYGTQKLLEVMDPETGVCWRPDEDERVSTAKKVEQVARKDGKVEALKGRREKVVAS